MTLTDVQAAMIRAALTALNDDPDFAHPSATITRIAGKEAADSARARESEYRDFNRDVKGNTANLSPDAAAYWADFQKMLRYGRLHYGVGDRSGTGKVLTDMCERLEESFDARVPDNEKAKFQVYDPQRMDGGNHDDRWAYCRDWFPPILKPEFLGDARVSNPKGRAQREVLEGILNPSPFLPLRASSLASGRLRELVRRLNQ